MQAQIASTPLPTELWTQIIRSLPSRNQRSCLLVSKLFHDISVGSVFASINIRLGLVRDNFFAHQDRWCSGNDEEEGKTDAAIRRSCELLQHIVRSPGGILAQAVRYVSVRAYSLHGGSPPLELMDALEEALSVLRLRGFAWYGCHPMPSRGLLEAISTVSGETLEGFVLPPELLLHAPIQGFDRLRSLSFLNRYAARYKQPGEEEDNPRSDSLWKKIATTSLPLRSLGLSGDVLTKCDIHKFSSLVELSLALITGAGDPIGVVFTHCSRLQSLTLLVGDTYTGDLALALRTHCDALPLLTAFQLSYPGMGWDMSKAIVAFLRNKLLLERLDLGHHASSRAFDDIEPVLDVLPGLPRLHVLGAELSGSSLIWRVLTPDHLQYLAQRIPPRLTALSVWVAARYRTTLTKEDWTGFFSELSSCRFIYVSTDHLYSGARVLRDALFDHPPPLAEIVGFNLDIAWVERDPETGRVLYSESWPLSKVYNRMAGEFSCEEWEWLLRQIDIRIL